MALKCERVPRAADAGTPENQSSGKIDILENRPSAGAKLLADLQNDYDAEAARLNAIISARAAATKLNHAADNFALHDFEDGKRASKAGRQYGAGVAAHIKAMEAALESGANAIGVEAL